MRATGPSAGAVFALPDGKKPAQDGPARVHFLTASCSSSSLQDGAQTGCDLPSSLRDFSMARGRCLPQRKQDMVAAPNEEVAANGEPGAFERYRRPSASIVVLVVSLATLILIVIKV